MNPPKVTFSNLPGSTPTGTLEEVQLSVKDDGGVEILETKAFVPELLPPKSLDRTECILKFHDVISEAREVLGRVEGIATRLCEPQILSSLFVRREARLSSAIENTFADDIELAFIEEAGVDKAKNEEAREVYNYKKAMENCLTSDLPISVRLIKSAHSDLLGGVRGNSLRPGEFRTIQNFIASRDYGKVQVRFIPPPPKAVPELISNLEAFINTDDSLPELVKAAVAHYQFEAIHPFLDGNGRIGRMLASLQLVHRTQLTRPLVYLSGYFERSKADYYDYLLNVSAKGDWFSWINYFLNGVRSEAVNAIERAESLATTIDELNTIAHVPRATALMPGIIDLLLKSPVISSDRVQQEFGVTNKSALKALRKLQDLGVLNELPKNGKRLFWFSPHIIKVMTQP